MTIPRELDEAAYIDGASPWTVYWRIILPLSKPAIIVIGVFTVVIAPIIVLFFFAQRRLIEGITLTGLKG